MTKSAAIKKSGVRRLAPTPCCDDASHALGQRQTRQRDAILRVLHAAGGPLPVAEIHALAQKKSKVGIATVYRTLKMLQQNEQIRAVTLPSGETRYESEPQAHHDHFQCRVCRQVFDLDACPLRLKSGSKLPGGFLVEDHQMLLYGLCPSCV
jgi:Fur family ferric uptake transcriptional regulator